MQYRVMTTDAHGVKVEMFDGPLLVSFIVDPTDVPALVDIMVDAAAEATKNREREAA